MMLTTKRTLSPPRRAPYSTPALNGGRVVGVIATGDPVGTMPRATWLSRLEDTWALIPASYRSSSALLGGLNRQGLAVNLYGLRDTLAALSPIAGSPLLQGYFDGAAINTGTLPLSVRTAWAPGFGSASGMYVDAALLHEFGHYVDWQQHLVRTGSAPTTDTERAALHSTPAWVALWNQAVVLGAPPLIQGRSYPANIGYGYTSMAEWFAEIWATRVITNMRSASEVEVYVTPSDYYGQYQPSLIHYLSGGSDVLYAQVMALFSEWFPLLNRPSPLERSFTGWT